MNFFKVIIFFFLITESANAKWASTQDAAIKTEFYNHFIKVNENGSAEEVIEEQDELLKDRSREYAADYKITYNEDSEKVQVIEAKTIIGGKEYKVTKDLIEDKQIASSVSGFDQYRQIKIAFPKAEVGAKIYIKYKYNVKKVPFEGFYSHVFPLGFRNYLDKAHIKLESKIPLNIVVSDPDKSLSITKDKEQNFNNIEIKTIKPIYKDVVSEGENTSLNLNKITWISISSIKKWEELSKDKMAAGFAKIYKQELPEGFTYILEQAKLKKTEIDQINTVTSMLNEKIQYMGDWRTINGRYEPRDFKDIADTQMGDCKDFSAATALILTKLGYKAQIAAVARGDVEIYENALPYIEAFNHVLVKATSKAGKVYWIDPTNFQSMADGIFPDIAAKPALILDMNSPSYEIIPEIDYNHSKYIKEKEVKIVDSNKTLEKGTLQIAGEEAITPTGAELELSLDAIKDTAYYMVSGQKLEEKDKLGIEIPDLKSRIVKDLNFKYSFLQNTKIVKTNLGPAYALTYSSLNVILNIMQDYVSDVFIGNPYTLKRKTIIKDIKVKNIESLNKEIDTKWLYISRKCTFDTNGIIIDDVIINKVSFILNEEIKSEQFVKLKQTIEKDFNDIFIIYN